MHNNSLRVSTYGEFYVLGSVETRILSRHQELSQADVDMTSEFNMPLTTFKCKVIGRDVLTAQFTRT